MNSLNTRRIGVKHTIRIKKGSNGGFGIKIAERDNMHSTRKRPIYITAITTTGSAYKDGRLKEGDMLLEVNGLDLRGVSQPELTKMLKAVGVNQEVEFVVSRQENSNQTIQLDSEQSTPMKTDAAQTNDCDKSLIDLDAPDQDNSVFVTSNQQFEKKVDSLLNVPIIDGPGSYTYDIPFNATKSAGLGLYIKYPRRAHDRKYLGIWIEKVITGGAAWKDGRLQTDDQILAINGINLIGLSNTEATATLTAAVRRGIGPKATPNTIQLKIQRRDPAVVAKILQETNSRNEYANILPNGQVKFPVTDKLLSNSSDSYQTAFDKTIQNSNDLGSSSGSSNQNSQSDSAMSPQTQASNSIKYSNSYNDKLDQTGSDKTNETNSSAISQMTDANNVPTDNSILLERDNFDQSDIGTDTQPKSLHMNSNTDLNNVDSSSQSWDDESTDANTGEDRFQRDGFGRQSISEKRHAQLNAKNTDTYKRNQKLREEQERQRQLEEQLARQHISDDNRKSYYQPNNVQKHLPTSYTTNEFKSIYGLQLNNEIDRFNHNEISLDNFHREMPVDVHMPSQQVISSNHNDVRKDKLFHYNNDQTRLLVNDKVPVINQSMNKQSTQVISMNQCPRCGSTSPCMCEVHQAQLSNQMYLINHNEHYNQMMKKSNSLESVQQTINRGDLIIPRAGTVRVARNRKVNESFRAAVDRSYEGNTTEQPTRGQDINDMNDSNHIQRRRPNCPTKGVSNSITTSNASTSNEERYLLSTNNGVQANGNKNAAHKKSSSLLTKFLKFGSIKRKKKDRTSTQPSSKTDSKSTNLKSISNRDSETTRSQTSKGSHSRTHSTQSHPNLTTYSLNSNISHKLDVTSTGQLNNLKQTIQPNHNATLNNPIGAQPQRSSMLMCQQHQPMIANANTQYQPHPYQVSMSQVKYAQNLPLNRPIIGNGLNDHQQYSQVPIQQHIHHSTAMNTVTQQQQYPLTPLVDHLNMNHMNMPQNLYSSSRNQIIGNGTYHPMTRPHQNGACLQQFHHQANPPLSTGQWQPSSHFQAPNGLWVTNSPVSEGQILSNNIYGQLPQQQSDAIINSPPHQAAMPANNSAFLSPMGNHQQQQQQHHQLSTQQMHNHVQPQHIYYYDF